MCDPISAIVSAGLAAGSAVASNAGNMQQVNAQGQQTAQNIALQAAAAQRQYEDNKAAADASNRVLGQYVNTQLGNQATNNASLAPALAAAAPATYQANQQQIANTSANNANSAITNFLQGSKAPTLSNTDNGQSAAEIQRRTVDRTNVSRQNATNAGTLNAFGTNLSNLGLATQGANREIDATNANARRQAGMLQTDEQNAALQARHYVPPALYNNTASTAGSGLQGLGSLGLSLAGSMGGITPTSIVSGIKNGLSGLGNVFNQPSVSNPGIGSPNLSGLTDNMLSSAGFGVQS
jgi:hypothetical protein